MLHAAVTGLETLPGLWSLTPIGFGLGALAFIFLGLGGGWLYTKRQHVEIVDLHKERHEIQKRTIEKHEQTIATQSKQLSDLIEANGITAAFFQKAEFVIQREADDAPQG